MKKLLEQLDFSEKILSIFIYVLFWFFRDNSITLKNIIEGYNGFDEDYRDKFASYQIARDSLTDATSRYDRIISKLFFTAQLQGFVLMGLSLFPFESKFSHLNAFFFLALGCDIISILTTVYALGVKKGMSLEYSKFGDCKKLKDSEQEEFNEVIAKLHDRCDFLTDLYKLTRQFFFFSLLFAFLFLTPIWDCVESLNPCLKLICLFVLYHLFAYKLFSNFTNKFLGFMAVVPSFALFVHFCSVWELVQLLGVYQKFILFMFLLFFYIYKVFRFVANY